MRKAALLLIDVQNAMFDNANPIYNGRDILKNLQYLIENSRTAMVPVLFIQHNDEEFIAGTNAWEIHPSVSPRENETIIQKQKPDSFFQTTLHETLQAQGIKTLMIAGNQTEYCIDTTTRRAHSLGYHVIIIEDAHGTWASSILRADEIIAHHNNVWANAFAVLQKTKEVEFGDGKETRAKGAH